MQFEKQKIAIVLFNLGGPDSQDAIEPFLMNFFTDKNIIRAPFFVRWMVAKMISKRRSKREAGDSYAELGHKSPLLENSLKQAEALKDYLNQDENKEHEVFVCMRYWHPMAAEVVGKVKAYLPDKIILLPLYPQFSTTTTKSSFEDWDVQVKKQNLDVPSSRVFCYPCQEGFIKASKDNILEKYISMREKNKHAKPPRILFSAHSLPEKVIKSGDPYRLQCEQTAEKIVEELNIEDLDWEICYQSRVGRLKWIGPSTEEALKKAISDNVPVVIYPHSFTQEHVETLVEIDVEYRSMVQDMGIVDFEKAETVGVHKDFIAGLGDLIQDALQTENVCVDGGQKALSKLTKYATR